MQLLKRFAPLCLFVLLEWVVQCLITEIERNFTNSIYLNLVFFSYRYESVLTTWLKDKKIGLATRRGSIIAKSYYSSVQKWSLLWWNLKRRGIVSNFSCHDLCNVYPVALDRTKRKKMSRSLWLWQEKQDTKSVFYWTDIWIDIGK